MTARPPGPWLRAALRFPPVAATLLAVAAVAGFQLFLTVTQPGRIVGLSLAGDAQPQDIAVELAFSPEPFHVAVFQASGRFVGYEDGRAIIRAVTAPALRALSRQYWVSRIEPAGAPP